MDSSQDSHILEVLYELTKGSRHLRDNFDKWLAVADEVTAKVPYETAAATIQQTGEGEDVIHWVHGYVVRGMVAGEPHGKKLALLRSLARDTNRSEGELREKSDCAEFYPPFVVKAYLDKDSEGLLSWSHFNRARRGMDMPGAQALLDDALEHGWSVARLEAERLKRLSPGEEDDEEQDSTMNKLNMAINALGQLAGLGLRDETTRVVRETRMILEEERNERGRAEHGIPQ